MKRQIALLLAVVMCFALCACGTEEPIQTEVPEKTAAPTPEPTPFEGTVDLFFNEDKTDTETRIDEFPLCDDRSTIYFHFIADATNDCGEVTLRIVEEKNVGFDDEFADEFDIESDTMMTVSTNTWQSIALSDSTASNIYLRRITVYLGETDTVLATKTVYTPYENSVYTKDDYPDEPPVFHAFDALTAEETAIYEKTAPAILDYANRNGYSSVDLMAVWQGETELYLAVQYKPGNDIILFAIRNDNPNAYSAGGYTSNVIPDGEGTEEQYVDNINYFYMTTAYNKNMG